MLIKESIKVDNCREVLYRSEYEWHMAFEDSLNYMFALMEQGYSRVGKTCEFVKYVPKDGEPTTVATLRTRFEEA